MSGTTGIRRGFTSTVNGMLDRLEIVNENGQLKSVAGLIGTGISGAFLLLIGILNLVILLDIIKLFRRMKAGDYDRQSLEHQLVAPGRRPVRCRAR